MTAVQTLWHLSRSGVDDAREIVVTLPLRTRSETNMREHWKARHRRRKLQRETIKLVLTGALLAAEIRPPCVVTLVRFSPGMLDDDNLRGALKATRDGVADALGLDDAHPSIRWEYDQRRSKRTGPMSSRHGVEVRIRTEKAA